MPSISKKRLIDVVNRYATRCYFVERAMDGFSYERHAASKQEFKDEINKRSEYDLECTLRFSGLDVELGDLDHVHIDNPNHRAALRVWLNEKLAEHNLWKPCQLDFVSSVWVDRASLVMNGWQGWEADKLMAELCEIGAIERLSKDGPFVLKPAAWRTAERENWNLEQ